MRPLLEPLSRFAREKFVLLSGPRQVGKTTLAKHWLAKSDGLYLNWDSNEDRATILSKNFLHGGKVQAVVLDEIHKYARWKSWLKGLYDKEFGRLEVVVTGSARLDIFQRGGDSLLGRYELLRLLPLTIGELTHKSIPEPPDDWLVLESTRASRSTWEQLTRRGGFPEPFFRDDSQQYRRWSNRRRSLLIREDLRDLTQIRMLTLVEQLALLLPSRVGSLLSVNALREELNIAHDTLSSWLDALERLYFCFRISPYTRRVARGLKKEQKLYMWDWSQVEDPASRFENMVAVHLLKSIAGWNDLGYGDFDLHFIRDKEKNEVDFVVTDRRRPLVVIECKLSDDTPSPALERFGRVLGDIPRIQLLSRSGIDRKRARTRVITAEKFLGALL